MKPPVIGLNMDCREKVDAPTYRIKSYYVDAIHDAGGLPLLIPSIPDRKLLDVYVGKCNAFVFIGGRDYPPEYYGEQKHKKTKVLPEKRYETDFMLADMVLMTGMPVLGICAGHQLINIVLGGKLLQHIEGHSDEIYHKADISEGSRILKSIFRNRRLLVNSSHHQALNPGHIGRGLKVCAVSGDGTVEAVEGTGRRKILGVQWHPERIRNLDHRRRLFRWLVNSAR